MRKKHNSGCLYWRVETIGQDIYLKRAEWGILPFLLVWLIFWGGILSAFIFLGVHTWQDVLSKSNSQNWRLCLIISVIDVIGLSAFVFVCTFVPAAAVSTVQFKMDDKTTRITYLGMFRRLISDWPSKVEIGGGGVMPVYAKLIYSNSRHKIPLFCTVKGAVDTTEQGKVFGLEQTAEIRNLLNLEAVFRG